MASGSSQRTVVLVFDATTLANYPGKQIGTFGKAFIRKLKDVGVTIIPFVVSARYTPEKARKYIYTFFSNIEGISDVKFAHNTDEQELYTENTVKLLYSTYTANSQHLPMPPVYFFDTSMRHVSAMQMFRSFHITADDSWNKPFEEITSSEHSLRPAPSGASPAPLSLGAGGGTGEGEPKSPFTKFHEETMKAYKNKVNFKGVKSQGSKGGLRKTRRLRRLRRKSDKTRTKK